MARLVASVLAAWAMRGVSGLGVGEYELVAHLRQRNLEEFEKLFWDIANPDHERYLRHLSVDEVANAMGASDDDIDSARIWLERLGASTSAVRVSPLRDMVMATFTHVDTSVPHTSLSAMSQQKPLAVEFVVRREPRNFTELYQEKLRSNMKQPLSGGYTVPNIKNAYGIPTDLRASNAKTLQMVWGPGSFGYSKESLVSFKDSQCPSLDISKVKFDTANHGMQGGDNYGEGDLDTQMISSFGLGVETVVSNTNTSASTEEGLGFGQAMLDFLTELASRKTLPQVLSLSLGSLSAASCNKLCTEAAKLGHTMKECTDYIQTQRQVCMFLSEDQQKRIDTALQVLGVRGVTVFGSSGDGGSHFSFGKFQGGAMADTLNKVSCEFQMPVFPTTSAFIVSVGGTMWANGDPSRPITWSGYGGGSGSGFSWLIDMPEHQKQSVSAYLATTKGLPPKSSFNSRGRAFPDISSIGVSGTSQSCPMTAGIFSMLMDKRLNAGLPPLGFVAPRLWKVAEQYPGEAFEDVTVGNSKTSCDNGFPSTTGWDPNTGWGRPVWAGMVKHFASDSLPKDSIVV